MSGIETRDRQDYRWYTIVFLNRLGRDLPGRIAVKTGVA